MKRIIVSIANTASAARSLDRYLRCFFKDQIVSCFMTYKQRLLSPSLFEQADLFVLDLLRRDDIGYCAEAIPVAEKWASARKRVLIVSGATEATRLALPYYWDLGTQEGLSDRVRALLDLAPPPPGEFEALKQTFASYCRSPFDNHS